MTKIYECGRLTFELRPELTIVRTPLQAFYLYPSRSYWKKKERFLRTLIELGKIEDLNQLAGFCWAPETKKRSAEQAVIWVGTSIPRSPAANCIYITLPRPKEVAKV